MASSALSNGKKIYSFSYSDKSWNDLKANKQLDFSMGCCDSEAVLVTSKLGLKFFRHKDENVDCIADSNGESHEHYDIKYLVYKKLLDCGWHAEVEKVGTTPSGEAWIADVYAEKGKAKIAIEIQWSWQKHARTKERQLKYEQSGVRCAWLLRSNKSNEINALTGDYRLSEKSLPVFSIYKDSNQGYMVHNVYGAHNNSDNPSLSPLKIKPMTLEDFLFNLVGGKLTFKNDRLTKRHRFYLTQNTLTDFSLVIAKQLCLSCNKHNKTAVGVNITNNGKNKYKPINKCDVSTIHLINEYFSKQYNLSEVVVRHSQIKKKSYTVNSCIGCGVTINRDNLLFQYNTSLFGTGFKKDTKSIFIKNIGTANQEVRLHPSLFNTQCVYKVDVQKNIDIFRNIQMVSTQELSTGKWFLT